MLAHMRFDDYAPTRRTPDGKIADVLPGKDSGFNARTRVHEYGGGETIVGDGAVYWSNFKCVSMPSYAPGCNLCVFAMAEVAQGDPVLSVRR